MIALEELFGHGLAHDEALGGDTALSAVDEPCIRGRSRRCADVGVRKDDEGTAAAELQHSLLQRIASLFGNLAARELTAGQRHRNDARIRDESRDRDRKSTRLNSS